MIAAVLALVGTIVGGVFQVVGLNKAGYAQTRAENQMRIDFERNKELGYFDMYRQQQTLIIAVIVAAIVVFGLIIYSNNKQK